MRTILHNIPALLFLFVTMVLGSCEFRPLEEPNRGVKINVNVNVRAVANVTTHIYNEKIPVPDIHPDAMHVVFYEEGGDRMVSEAFITGKALGEDGSCVMTGYANVLPGTYRMVVYSFGTFYSYVNDCNSWSRINARALQASEAIRNRYNTSVMPMARSEAIVTYTPDHVVVASNPEEKIPFYSGSYTIHAEATTVVETYYLQIKVDGLQYVSSARAYLSGMASGNLLSERRPIHEPESVLYFDMEKGDDKGEPVICAVFNTFGRIEDSTNNLSVTFDVITVDGRNETHTFDITGLFHTEECRKYHWLLLEERIKIDAPDGSGGFKPGVSDWEDDNHKVNF